MTQKNSQVTMYEHSEVKVRLLKTYLERYFNVLNNSKFVNDIHYFDFFSAEGIYSNGGKGSPIAGLESIKKAYYNAKHKSGNSGKFHCLFNDLDRTKIKQLEINVKKLNLHHPEIGTINYENKDYQDLCPEISSKLNLIAKNDKAFVFIDPYGYKEIRISDIKSLLGNKKTEVLLFLPTHFMFRFSENGTPESLFDFINEIVPKDKWPLSKTGLDFIDNLTKGFKDYLGDDFFVDTFVISRDKNQFFCLFFFTSHIYGFDRMLDSKWSLDEEDGRGWKFNASNDLFSQVEKQPNTERFENNLLDYLKTNRRSNSDLYEFTLRNGHLPKHINDILKKIQDEGKLKTELFNGSLGRKSAFYINYENYKNQPNRIFFSFKN